ncbi:(2Fe-2S)-binding protein [Cytobacillus sp. IB215316]|uniref:(2Fe-2S)-binding protein n=2 Tax=Bacillaceae TaxID=186817 RepID=UPI0039B76E18
MMTEAQTIICRCEEVTYEEVFNAIQQYMCSSREIKLRTRAGMGCCGGRTCRVLLESLIQDFSEFETERLQPLKYQPPIRPVSFGLLGENK